MVIKYNQLIPNSSAKKKNYRNVYCLLYFEIISNYGTTWRLGHPDYKSVDYV